MKRSKKHNIFIHIFYNSVAFHRSQNTLRRENDINIKLSRCTESVCRNKVDIRIKGEK